MSLEELLYSMVDKKASAFISRRERLAVPVDGDLGSQSRIPDR